jgi:glyoxylase-like metal-dependent hydrolase (beta-lactamase superfamily II)
MLLQRSTKEGAVKELAPGVARVHEFAPVINAYVVEDVLIDTARRWDRKRIFKAIEGRELSLVALTHVHGDHNGVAKDVCDARGIPLVVHADDVEVMERGGPTEAELAGMGRWARFVWRSWGGPAYPVDRVLEDGDEVAGFRVVHAPGHSRGEVIFFRESDRVAICGDVIRNLSYATLRPKLQEPPEQFNWDTAENRRSIRKLAALEPSLILPGHGGAVRDMDEFQDFVDLLPRD